MKKVLSKIHYLICCCIASIKYPDIWSLKAATLRSNNGGYISVYYNRLKNWGRGLATNLFLRTSLVFPTELWGFLFQTEQKLVKTV